MAREEVLDRRRFKQMIKKMAKMQGISFKEALGYFEEKCIEAENVNRENER